MRIPDDLLTTPIFLGGCDDGGRMHYRATAFLVGLPTDRQGLGWPVLVTARHNVNQALRDYGNVWIRVNTPDGRAQDVEIPAPWIVPDEGGSDVAILPWRPPFEWESLLIPARWFVTPQVISERQIGVGDDLVVMGLFASHVGQTRNLPIVRSGNIASMPIERFTDQDSGDTFDAYLAEVRSIGGLSGSPVFVVLNPLVRHHGVAPTVEQALGQPFVLLGLIRGHWTRDSDTADFSETEAERLNTGIAMVTPITEVLPLFEHDALIAYRREEDEAWDEREIEREDNRF